MSTSAERLPGAQRWKVVLARCRPVLLVLALLTVFGPFATGIVGLDIPDVPLWVFVVVFAAALLAMFVPAFAVEAPPAWLAVVPVEGRWVAMNSCATRVPSHGTLAYGQSHAIDLVAEPLGGGRPVHGQGPAFRPATDYPAFGTPVLAPDNGVIVTSSGWRRDHRARSSNLAVAYMLAEGMIRELGGAGFVVGNHVVIQRNDGTFILMAHLQQGSLQVAPGDRVAAGDPVASCGNSGNSSEPHLHLQVMDHRRASVAAGLPFGWQASTVDGDQANGVPANGAHMLA